MTCLYPHPLLSSLVREKRKTFCFVFVAIILGHLKIPVVDFKRAVLLVDETILTSELLQQILAYAPDAKEVRTILHALSFQPHPTFPLLCPILLLIPN